ncbi:MAG: glycosyltransferase family 1 protein [Ilumatobacteraceae bacterium]
MDAVRVGFDVGPLAGHRTGVGHAVAAMRDALRRRNDVHLEEYLISFRAKPTAGERRLPLPALVALRLWAKVDWPSADRWIHDVDVIHGTNYVVPPSKVPRVVSVYDCWFLRHPGEVSADVRRASEVLRRSVAAGAVVHASSHATADAARELLPGARVEVVSLGALPVLTAPAIPPIAELVDRPFIVAIGTLERRKNLPTLVRAFGHIAAEHTDVGLVLAGADGNDRQAIDAAVDAIGPAAAERVLLTGRVDAPTRAWLLRHARVLAYPSLDEGFGFPLLDAMQLRVPVVASDAGSIPEVAGDAALLAPPRDIEGLAANLAAALADETTRTRLIAAGDRRWRQFDWDECAAQLTSLYTSLAGGAR